MTFDVAARLAEGRPAVTNTQTYVDACRAVGYQHADLTAGGAQVHEWYASEGGMDLNALDGDCAALRAAAGAADEALRIERAGLAALASAWHGDSGGTATEFVDRHCSAGAAVADALRAAAATCIALRDNLWRLVDEKVTAASTIDDRCFAERATWLAAARTVTTGAADRAGAEDIVRQKVTPYVDRDIRTDWVGAMRSARTSVSAAYGDAEHALSSHGAVRFEIPAQLGPPIPSAPSPTAGRVHVDLPAPPAPTVPAAAPAMPPVTPAPAPEVPTALPPVQPPSVQPPPAQPLSAPLGTDVAPTSGAGGLSGLVAQIIDSLGSLFDAPGDAAPDSAELPEPDAIDSVDGEDPVDDGTDDPAPDEEPAAEPEHVAPLQNPDDQASATPLPEAEAEVEPPAPESVATPPPVMPPPALAEATDDAATPCEIAADELPQVGQ